MRIEPLTAVVGAVVHDVDLRTVNDGERQSLVAAWHEWGVLFFRDQHLDDAAHVEAARIFGEPVDFEMAPATSDVPFVHRIINERTRPRRSGGVSTWHSDATWRTTPPRGSMLRSIELPERGGDTLFASATAAYRELSDPMQRFVATLTATHHGGFELGKASVKTGNPVPEATVHPVVSAHPETGEPALFVNGVFTQHLNDMSTRESDALLALLLGQFSAPEVQCRFRWQAGDVALWDNRAVQHYAAPDYQGRRLMHRVVFAGEPVSPAFA